MKIFQKENEVPTESELLDRYRQSGDVGLLGRLYQPYMQMIFAVCYKYLKDDEQSKDAVMNIFEKLVEDLRSHEVGNFSSWLHSVARNHCLMILRSQKVFASADTIGEEEGDLFSIDWQNEDDFIQLDSDLAVLEKCMSTLASEQRTSISLFYLKEKCYREISDETGFEIRKVKSYIQNGKRNLKICMDKNGR